MSTKPCPQCQRFVANAAQFCNFCGYVFSPGLTGQLAAKVMLDNRYLIVELVGKGGMGAVYRAIDTRLKGRICAIKEMSAASLPWQERVQAMQQFEQEAMLLARLRHPHLPQVHDFFKDDSGRLYLAMDFVEGETLGQRLVRQGQPFSETQVRLWAEQLCDVLTYLHGHNPPIIFRDLKPDNIMLDKNNQIKLIDFGIARLFKSMQTRDTQVIGTPGYAAPEQYGQGQTDARADIYSLGATLLTLLTGHDPSTDPLRLPNARQLDPSVSGQMAAVIHRATQPQASDRYQSAREFRQALQPAGAFGAIGWSAVTKSIQTWRALGTVAVIVGIVLVFLVASGLWPPPKPSSTVLTQTADANLLDVITETVVVVQVTVVETTAVTATVSAGPLQDTPIPPTQTVTPRATPTATTSPTAVPTTVPRIVFQSNRTGNFEIYSININGDDLRRLTNNSWADQYPAVSPDGSRITFQSNRDGDWEIYVMDIDGRYQRRLTIHNASDRLPSWSPNNQHIVFASNRNSSYYNLFIVDAEGHYLRQVTDTRLHEGHVSWSVDDLLVYNAGGTNSRNRELYVVDIDGQNRRQLTNNQISDWSPEWSPNGRTILYLSDPANNDNPGIYLINSDGTNSRLLYDSPDYEWGARWSSGGQQIVFTILRNDVNSIHIMDADGRNVRLIVERGSYPAWVP